MMDLKLEIKYSWGYINYYIKNILKIILIKLKFNFKSLNL